MPLKDLLHFDAHGLPRTAQEIADLQADSGTAFDDYGRQRTAEEIAAMKWKRVTEREGVQEIVCEGLETFFRVYNATRIEIVCTPSNLNYISQRLKEVRGQEDYLLCEQATESSAAQLVGAKA